MIVSLNYSFKHFYLFVFGQKTGHCNFYTSLSGRKPLRQGKIILIIITIEKTKSHFFKNDLLLLLSVAI